MCINPSSSVHANTNSERIELKEGNPIAASTYNEIAKYSITPTSFESRNFEASGVQSFKIQNLLQNAVNKEREFERSKTELTNSITNTKEAFKSLNAGPNNSRSKK